ncbi:hypothetical protein N7516_007815 [Penicillium verrucosum]|uniref:uncharacterized protein n=1 Tax=Penicillium verrucosum TaxID=60171 RepID=UPI002544DB0C|nr:uncharacterized protein N7516_007815 [Penicillium verrucosum]KAJ5926042.1 hypothetical protein N7516_007815 [Penicillium verrucosum]
MDAEDLTWDLLLPAPGVDTWGRCLAVEVAVEWCHLEDPQSAMGIQIRISMLKNLSRGFTCQFLNVHGPGVPAFHVHMRLE